LDVPRRVAKYFFIARIGNKNMAVKHGKKTIYNYSKTFKYYCDLKSLKAGIVRV